jgi:hypothetical protein
MPWRVVSLAWPRLVDALWPLDLAELIVRLPKLLARFARLDADGEYRADEDRSRPLQVDDFRSRFEPHVAKAA